VSPDVPLVGGLPFVGPLANKIDENTRLIAQAVDDQARLMASLPRTLQAANDAIAALSQTIVTLDKNIQRANRIAEPLLDPLEQIAPTIIQLAGLLEKIDVRQVPDLVEQLREAIPALRGAAQTQQQVASVVASMDKLIGVLEDVVARLGEFPGSRVITRALNLAGSSAREAGARSAREAAGAEATPASEGLGETDAPGETADES
jgi:methyl-accepting chemotaxis protein